MLSMWYDINRDLNRAFGWRRPGAVFSWPDFALLTRRMSHLLGELDGAEPTDFSNWPRVNLYDDGDDLVISAELPGLTAEDVEVTVLGDHVTIGGSRTTEVPEGYTAHRRERPALEFKRTFALPYKVDPEQVDAGLENGILTVRLAKAAESKPRRISVRSA